MDWFYNSRAERSKWLVERFRREINRCKNVLDVGCYNGEIKKLLKPKVEYTGIDIAGTPDIKINLDKIDCLPFNNKQFDLIVCADVLEHLENIHLIFDELCRVTNKYMIITLPNAYSSILEFIKGKKYSDKFEKRKEYGKYSKFYGLPLEKPPDRHRWFFSYDEAIEFVKYRAGKFNIKVISTESEYKYSRLPMFKKLIVRVIKKVNHNLVERNIIILLEKS